jgi:hypothetical protein
MHARSPVEYGNARLLLDTADRCAQLRLSHAHALSCASEMEFVCYGEKQLQLLYLHHQTSSHARSRRNMVAQQMT